MKLKLNLSGTSDRSVKSLIKKACEAVLKTECFKENAEVSVLITDSVEVQKLNKEFRGKDKTTDVLSFPMNEINPENGYLILGDIIINAELVKKQAEDFGHGEQRELAFLTIHSMLHLLGYEHENDKSGEKIMREKQDKILTALGLGIKDD